MDGAQVSIGCGCDRQSDLHSLLGIEEARALALANIRPITQTETLPLSQALGRTAAAHISAPRAMPFFDNSAMDGFALRSADLNGRCCLPIAGTVAAGDAPKELPANTALRIFTGAPLPLGADTVAMIEDCIDKTHKVHFSRIPNPGDNIRRAGSDQSAGQILLTKGTRIAPRHIGLLAANGISDIAVLRRPRIGVFSTGDEVTTGPCKPGQIPDANRPLLCALLAQNGADVHDLGILPDDPDATAKAFGQVATGFDLILTSGAVSMGGKDHIRDALLAAGGDIHGWRVAIKPGKPVMFGTLGDTVLTGLPGNPLAVYVGFHLFVLAQLARLTGAQPAPFAPVSGIADFDWQRKTGRSEVFAVRQTGVDAHGVPRLERLGAGVSATLVPLAHADGLAIVPADTSTVTAGDNLRWHPFCSPGTPT